MKPATPILRLLFASAAILACASCATLDEGECRTADWRRIGYVDGRDGRESSRLVEHEKSCSDYGVRPDTQLWTTGYNDGLAMYCTAPNGYVTGRRGDYYNDVCPPEMDRVFRPAWEDGRRIAQYVHDLDELDSQLDRRRDILDNDAVRASRYIEQVREARRRHEEPPPSPELLSRYERDRLAYEFDQLLIDYRNLRGRLDDSDRELSELYYAAPLSYQYNY